jgi:hypothetical protein
MLNALLLLELARADEQVRRGRATETHVRPHQRASMAAHEARVGAGWVMRIDRALTRLARRTTDGLDVSR